MIRCMLSSFILFFSGHLAVKELSSISRLLLFCMSHTNPATFPIVSTLQGVKTLKEQRSC